MRALFLTYAVQGLVLAAAGLGLMALSRPLRRRYGPAWLCRAWLALAVLLVLPVRLLLPQAAPAPVRLTPPAVLLEAAPAEAQTLSPPEGPALPAAGGEGDDAPGAERAAGQAAFALPAPLDALALVWLAGAGAVLGWQWLTYGAWRRRTLRRSLPAPEPWQTALNAAIARQPVGRRVRVLAGPVEGPLVTGILRPVLLVPEGAAPGPEAACVLAHELAHLRRHDLAGKALFTLARALHWCDPLVWLLLGRAEREMEYACDAAALAALGPDQRAAYGGALLQAAGRAPALAGGFVFSKREMKARLARLWDAAPKRRGAAALALVCLAGCGLAGLVACGEPAGEPSASEPAVSEPAVSEPTPAADLAGDRAVWPAVYYGSNGSIQAYRKVTDRLPFTEIAEPGRWVGYADPGFQYIGAAQHLYGEEMAGSARLTLWNTSDGGESWAATPLDLSAWLDEQAEAGGWAALGPGTATAIPTFYQFVDPEVGFLACWGDYTYEGADGPGYARSNGFLLLRTTDGGASWERMYSGDGTDLAEGERISLPNSGASFAFLNENVGFLCAGELSYGLDGHFNILRTTDGGRSWERLDLSELEASLPGGPWNRPHAFNALGLGVRDMPEGIPDAETPGSIALLAWDLEPEGGPREEVVLYSRDWGESWDWVYRDKEDREANGQQA